MTTSNNNQFLPVIANNTFLKIKDEIQNDGHFYGFPKKDYSGFDEFIIHVVHKGDSRHLHFLNQKFSLFDALEQPSIRSMVCSGINDIQAVEIIKSLFEKLVSLYPNKEEFSLDEFGWFVYNTYGHLSLLGLVAFCVRIDNEQYINKRRHYPGKGMKEWILKECLISFAEDWENARKKNAINRREEQLKECNIEVVTRIIDQFKIGEDKRKLHFVLRNKAKEKTNKLSDEQQYIKAYEKYDLSFNFDCFHLSKKELRAKSISHCETLKIEWCREYTRLSQDNNEEGVAFYFNSQFRIARLQLEKNYRFKNTQSYLNSTITDLIKINQITNGSNLIKLIGGNENFGIGANLDAVRIQLVQYVFKSCTEKWNRHEKKIFKEEVDYSDFEYFQKVFVWKWVYKYCHPHLKSSTK